MAKVRLPSRPISDSPSAGSPLVVASRATASSATEPKAAIRLIPASSSTAAPGKSRCLAPGADDPQAAVDQQQHARPGALEQRFERRRAGRVVDHAGSTRSWRGANA